MLPALLDLISDFSSELFNLPDEAGRFRRAGQPVGASENRYYGSSGDVCGVTQERFPRDRHRGGEKAFLYGRPLAALCSYENSAFPLSWACDESVRNAANINRICFFMVI